MNVKQALRVLVVLIVVVLGVTVFTLRPAAQKEAMPDENASTELPLLVDLGADKCANCKKMAAILEGLEETQASYFSVEFIDVWKNPEAAAPYEVKLIPTQVFLSASGEELFRHEGFFSREEILAKWNELGVETGSI